eukprot:3444911-Prymnesium_polylepis.1
MHLSLGLTRLVVRRTGIMSLHHGTTLTVRSGFGSTVPMTRTPTSRFRANHAGLGPHFWIRRPSTRRVTRKHMLERVTNARPLCASGQRPYSPPLALVEFVDEGPIA